MADLGGAWLEPSVGEEDARSPGDRSAEDQNAALEGELSLLEARVADATELMIRLREERAGLARERESLVLECSELRRECEALRREREAMRRDREETAARLAQIIAKVDALRGEP
jgi:chromosome segregation ATPase